MPAAGGGDRLGGREPGESLAAKPAHEVHVLHQWNGGIAAEALEHVTPDKQRLIAVRKLEISHAQGDRAFDHTRAPVGAVEREGEASPDGTGCAVGALDFIDPVARHPCVGVKEE